MTAPGAAPQTPGYDLGPLLHTGSHCLVYRGTQRATGRAVTIRTNRDPYPSDRERAVVQAAFDLARELAQDLDGDTLVEHLDLIQVGHGWALVIEDFGGEPLDRTLGEGRRREQAEVLAIGLALARALARLHARGVVHLGIHPGNLLWDPRQGRLKLSDLSRATRLRQESVAADHDPADLGAPTYLAPEQTGRTNKSVDLRADLYAAGVVLYELCAGAPPFVSPDPRELIHAHLARQPPDLRQRRPGLHPALPRLVHRLLAKDPEARYASAAGLAADLERARDELDLGIATDFPLGAWDQGGRFAIPERLYGRSAEIATLVGAWEAAAEGERRCVLVGGWSGVGKSSLIDELHVPMAGPQGWYCPGKFDQFHRDLPYLAWREALAALTQQALALPETELAQLRAALEQGLAGNGALVLGLVPGAETLLGPQAPLPEVGPTEAQARFDLTLRAFLRALAGARHPVALFLDDLQWADLASLQLLESMVADPAAAHLLILGAYRDNEVGPGHPLTTALGRLEAQGRRPQTLSLPPLTLADTTALVADTLHLEADSVAPLATLVFAKTGGNPFFLRQFLERLAEAGRIALDLDAGRWGWDLAAIEAQGYTDNVVEFMAGRLGELPDRTRRMLQLGACLGATFDLQGLVSIAARPQAEVVADLEPALATGLLLPLGADYRLAEADARLAQRDGRAPGINPRYAFLHDRVQQGAHESIAVEGRAVIHLAIARGLVAEADPDNPEPRAVEVMDHLAEALTLVDSQPERLAFARVCLLAGRRARAAQARPQAVRYLAMGRELLAPDPWSLDPDLALDLHLEGAEAGYVTERYDEAEALAREVLARTQDLDRRVAAHNVRIGIGVAQRRYVEATRVGLDVLEAELGVALPRRAGQVQVLAGLARTALALRGRSPAALLDLPPMGDPRARAAMAILMKSATNAYWGSPNLVPLIAGRMVRLTLAQGSIGLSAYGYALLGMIFTNAVNAVDAGCRLGALSMDLLARTGDRHLVGKTGLLWHGFTRHARDPLRLCAADTLACYDQARDAGDLENAVYCGTVAYYADLLAGRSLDWVEQRYAGYLPALLGSSQAQTVQALRVWVQVAANLADAERVEPRAVGAWADWPTRLDELLPDPGSAMAIATVAGGAGWLAFLLDDWDQAERQFGLLYERAEAALGQAFWKPCMALYGLVLARRPALGTAGRLRLARVRHWLNGWARHNPHDFAPYRQALRAQRAARRGRGDLALAAWHDTAAGAAEGGNLFLAAWATEQAAHAHGGAGHREEARALLERARGLWQRHGSRARLRLVGAGSGEPERLTLDAVLGAVRAVSESIEVDRLVDRVLEILLVQAGARRVTLLVQDEGLTPLAAAVADDAGRCRRLPGTPGAGPTDLPLRLVDYVARTRRTLVVDNARTHEWLSRDPYVQGFERLSLAAAPLLRHGRLVGLAVLENELGTGAFTPAAGELVEAIAGQVAVSLENARLFEAQRRQAEAFGRFVPRPFLEHLGHKRIEDIRLGEGVQRQLTVMFTDLRGFTSLSERVGPNDTFALVNAILARLGPALTAEGGFIDEFTGDGVKALFIGRADGALRAAIAMQQRLRRYSTERIAQGRVPLAMGIGVHTGGVMLGTIGSQGRMSTTVLGDTVNTTARLEGLTKVYGTPVLLSEGTRAELEDPLAFCLRTVGRVRFKGRAQAILVHEAVDAREPAERAALAPWVPRFNEALAAYFDRRFEAAAEGFAACLAQAPQDPLARDYLAWAERCRAEGVGDDWEGIMVREEK